MARLPERSEAVWLGASAAGLLVAQQVAGKTTRDALFLSYYPANVLPQVMMAASLVAVGAALAAGKLMSARGPQQAVPALVGLHAALLLLAFPLAVSQPAFAAVFVYLLVAATGAALLSGYWSLVNERFDPWTARRAMARLGLGASLGGVGGGLLVWSATGALSVQAMLLVTAALNVAALVAVVRFGGHASPARRPTTADPATSPWTTLRSVPYLRTLALVVVFSALVEAMLDYVLKARAAAAFERGPSLMAFFAAFHSGTALLALGAQTLLTRPALEGLGLAGTVALRPLAVAVTSFAGLVDPRLWSAVVSRGTHDLLANSLFRSGYELLYTPLPEAEKRATKQVVDVALDKLGALVGGGLALAAVGLLAAPDRALLPLAGGLSLVVVGLTARLQRGYVATLEQSLRAGRVNLDAADVVDSTTRLTFAATLTGFASPAAPWRPATAAQSGTPTDPLLERIAELRSGQADRIRRVLHDPIARDVSLVPHVLPLLGRNDLYVDVLRALRDLAPRSTGQLLDALLDPETDLPVRRRLPRVLKACRSPRAVRGLLTGLDDPSFDVRSQCALALTALAARSPELRAPVRAVFAATRRELERPQAAGEAGVASAARLEHVFVLLALVLEREPLQIAAWALRGRDAGLRGTALEYLENVLPGEVRGPLFALLGAARPQRRPRPRPEVLQELLRSGDVLAVARDAIRRRALRPRG